jgi:hypothetical protein
MIGFRARVGWGALSDFDFMPRMHGGEYAPLQPPFIAGRKGGGGTGMKGLARDGARWPSGARPSRPLAGGQAAGAGSRFASGIAKTQRCPDTEKSPERMLLEFLCVFASLRLNFVFHVA